MDICLKTCFSSEIREGWCLISCRLLFHLGLGFFALLNIVLGYVAPGPSAGSPMHVILIVLLLLELGLTGALGSLLVLFGDIRNAILVSRPVWDQEAPSRPFRESTKLCLRVFDVAISSLFLCAYFGLLLLEFLVSCFDQVGSEINGYLVTCSIFNLVLVFIRAVPVALVTGLIEIVVTFHETRGQYVVKPHPDRAESGPSETSPLIQASTSLRVVEPEAIVVLGEESEDDVREDVDDLFVSSTSTVPAVLVVDSVRKEEDGSGKLFGFERGETDNGEFEDISMANE